MTYCLCVDETTTAAADTAAHTVDLLRTHLSGALAAGRDVSYVVTTPAGNRHGGVIYPPTQTPDPRAWTGQLEETLDQLAADLTATHTADTHAANDPTGWAAAADPYIDRRAAR